MGFLAMTQANVPVLGVASLDSSLAVARATAERALANDSTVVEASIAESFALASDMRLADAIRPLEKALRIDSTNVDLLLAEALALAQVGRVEDGLGYALRARERDPLYVAAVGITAYLLEMVGRYDDAIAAARAAIELDPNSAIGRRGLGFTYVFAGKPDSAVAQLETALALDSTAFGARANLVFGYAAAGRWADAARQRLLAEREGERSNSANYYRVLVALAFGEDAAAMAAFERGVSDREPHRTVNFLDEAALAISTGDTDADGIDEPVFLAADGPSVRRRSVRLTGRASPRPSAPFRRAP
jgi:tetratricopeptide (TPR) repeat protein